MKFSIIVPTYNEENDIKFTLDSLVALDYPNFEVFMVDDSTDATPDIIRSYADKGIQLIKPGGGGRCEARNIGIKQATGDILIILNADVQLPRDFLHQIKKHYDNNKVDFLCVRSRALNDDRLFARYVDCVGLYEEENPPNKDWPMWTEGFSCRKELALKTPLFPAGFPIAMYAGEDVVFAENLAKAGGKKYFDKNIVVTHIAPASYEEYWRIRKSRGRACSQYRRYIDKWSMKKIIGWNTLKTGYNLLKLFSIVMPLHFCWKISHFSKVGRKDWLPLYYAHTIETLAMTYGFWQELWIIYKKEKQLCKSH